MKGAIILSRLDSSRLPGKALVEICGRCLLEWCIESLKYDEFYKVIIATTTRKIDDPIVEVAIKNNLPYFRGETNNVAQRILDTAKFFNLKYFARINGDSPFIRRKLIKLGFEKIEEPNYDFVTNLVPRRFPYGISVEVFNTDIFEKTILKLESPEQKEHVTSYFYENITQFNPYCIKYDKNDSNDHFVRLVVDDKNDLEMTRKIIKKIGNNFREAEIEEFIKIYTNIKKLKND